MKNFAVFAVLLSLTSSAFAGVSGRLVHQYIARKLAQQQGRHAFAVSPSTYDQKIDHFTPMDTRTFKQRYLVDNTYAVNPATSPVLYYQCGEGNCLDGLGYELPAVLAAASKLQANLVIVEHRFYGTSQPFPEMTTEHLRYLTYEQALEDFAEFQKYAQTQLGLGGKWIFVGGSYSGALSAYYRLKHPDLVVGALSSSGVVKNIEAYEDYDLFVAKGLGPACLSVIQNATHQVEAALNDPAQLATFKALFNASQVEDGLDFLGVMSAIPAFAVQYGMQDQFCQELPGKDPIHELAAAGKDIFSRFGVNPLDLTPQGLSSVQATDYEGSVGFRQWFWQSCYEFGGFDIPYHDPKFSAQSALLDLNYSLKTCQRVFGLIQAPQTEHLNQLFYEPLLGTSASNILYTNGSSDPYSPLSISAEQGNNTDPNTEAFTITGGSHCSDLGGATSQSISEAQDLFLSLAAKWLK